MGTLFVTLHNEVYLAVKKYQIVKYNYLDKKAHGFNRGLQPPPNQIPTREGWRR